MPDWIKSRIRTVVGFPKPGIEYRDITTLLADEHAFKRSVDELVDKYKGVEINKVVGIEARGFILGGAMAHQLETGFVPIRKAGKLPHVTLQESYKLEYGTDTLEIHEDAIATGDLCLLVDDLIATGGTALAAINLIEGLGGKVAAMCSIVDLPTLGGSQKIKDKGIDVVSLAEY